VARLGRLRDTSSAKRGRAWSVTGSDGIMAASISRRLRLDIGLLDPENPFEIDDGNRVHLMKHLLTDDRGRQIPVGPEDILDAYLYGDPDYYEADEGGQADWLMVGMIPELVLTVPIAPPNSGDARYCRPIGLYKPSVADRNRYLRGQADE
jgi:hypothetical protein